MEPYRHFGLNAAPFDGPPDPRFFYGTTSHAETLAALQYAVHSGKACTLVLGESGSGKTLVGQVLAQSVWTRDDVLWVHGLGQPPGEITACLCNPAGLGALGAPGARSPAEVKLAQWLRSTRPAPRRTLVVVDDVDGLRPGAWEELLPLVTREIRSPVPILSVLLGLPTVLDLLGQPPLVRLQRRLFRVCHLSRLTGVEVSAYIRHRVGVVGRKTNVFTAAALAAIHRPSEGNPALVNQLCDNALVEAFGDDCPQIDVRHIVAAARSIMGQVTQRDGPPEAESVNPVGADSLPIVDESQWVARLRAVTTRPHLRDVAGAPGGRRPGCEPLGDRLRTLESQLSEAFTRVRRACQRPGAGDQPAADVVSEGSAS
jgi:type II secretory pathway predicted ATPase ExeA